MKTRGNKTKKFIAEIRNTRDYENLKKRLGLTLGRRLYKAVNMLEECNNKLEEYNNELEIIHLFLTENYEILYPQIKDLLSEIEKRKNNNGQ